MHAFVQSLRANRQAVLEAMEYGGITVGLWRMKDLVCFYRFSESNNNGIEVGLGPLLAILGARKTWKWTPVGSLWEVFGGY